MHAARSGGSEWPWLLVVIPMTLLLVLSLTADFDGDPLTSNLPDAVLVPTPSASAGSIDHSDDSDREPREWDWMHRRVRQFRRRADRWTQLLRRFHRAIITDIPI